MIITLHETEQKRLETESYVSNSNSNMSMWSETYFRQDLFPV